MGITLHYKGRIKDKSLIPELTAEVQDICETMGWEYHIIHHDFKESPERIKKLFGHNRYTSIKLDGITVLPHEDSETLSLVFAEDGWLTPLIVMPLLDYPDDLTKNRYWTFIKTQFAGYKVHIAVVKLLKYIQKKYLTDFEVSDESDYWETGDEEIAKEKFAFLDSAINMVTDALDITDLVNAPTELLIEKIEKVIRKLMDDMGLLGDD